MVPTKGFRGRSPGLPPVHRHHSKKKRERALGCGLCRLFAMHWSQHHRCKSATHLQTTVNDPSTSPRGQAPQVRSFPRRQCICSVSGTLCSPAHCLPSLGCSGPTAPAGPVQEAGTSPREGAGVRDLPPCLAITASRKPVLAGSAPTKLQ